MNKIEKTGSGTLRGALIMGIISSSTTLITAILGRSTTQIVDFIRRLTEAFSTFVSYVFYHQNLTEPDEKLKARNDRKVSVLVNSTLVLSGLLMIFISIMKYRLGIKHKNVIPGFAVSAFGIFLNSGFALKYYSFLKKKQDQIIQAQFHLYRTKTLVDSCVTFTVAVMIFNPEYPYLDMLDLITSMVISLIMILSSIKNLRKEYIIMSCQKSVNPVKQLNTKK